MSKKNISLTQTGAKSFVPEKVTVDDVVLASACLEILMRMRNKLDDF